MKMLGAQVRPVRDGSATLKDAMNAAIRDWIAHPDDTYYLLGTGAGPHPYPWLVRELQKVIGEKRGRRSSRRRGGCRTRWWPASAGAPTPSAFSIRS